MFTEGTIFFYGGYFSSYLTWKKIPLDNFSSKWSNHSKAGESLLYIKNDPSIIILRGSLSFFTQVKLRSVDWDNVDKVPCLRTQHKKNDHKRVCTSDLWITDLTPITTDSFVLILTDYLYYLYSFWNRTKKMNYSFKFKLCQNKNPFKIVGWFRLFFSGEGGI